MAFKQASKSQHSQHRVGAVITKNGRVLSTGFNQMRYTKELNNPTLHAEEDAILKMLKTKRLSDLVGADIYVTRFTKGGNVGLARPCNRCFTLCQSVGISRLHYSTSDRHVASEVIV
jgi:deoxycytidylate deaminase